MTECIYPDCTEHANYWYIEDGASQSVPAVRLGMCFGHATYHVLAAGRYGRRAAKHE